MSELLNIGAEMRLHATRIDLFRKDLGYTDADRHTFSQWANEVERLNLLLTKQQAELHRLETEYDKLEEQHYG